MSGLILPDNGAPQQDGKRRAPSAERNLGPIIEVLDTVLPSSGRVLELASGTGQHIAAFGARWPHLVWQPSDAHDEPLATTAAWCAGLDAVAPPLRLDATQPGWGAVLGGWQAICLTNLLHLVPADSAETLLREVSLALAPGGVFCLYGPFRRDGQLVSEGDQRFDASLRAQDPRIGYKDVEWVEQVLVDAGLCAPRRVGMPADNLMILARKPD